MKTEGEKNAIRKRVCSLPVYQYDTEAPLLKVCRNCTEKPSYSARQKTTHSNEGHFETRECELCEIICGNLVGGGIALI